MELLAACLLGGMVYTACYLIGEKIFWSRN
jgi:hypothetical protein